MNRWLPLLLVVLISTPALAEDDEDKGKKKGIGPEWHRKESWKPKGAPGPDDDVLIKGAVMLGGVGSCKSLKIKVEKELSAAFSGHGTLKVAGDVNVNGKLVPSKGPKKNGLNVWIGGDLTVGPLGRWEPRTTTMNGDRTKRINQRISLSGVNKKLHGRFVHTGTSTLVAGSPLHFTGPINLGNKTLDMKGKTLVLEDEVRNARLDGITRISGKKKKSASATLGQSVVITAHGQEIRLSGVIDTTAPELVFESDVRLSGRFMGASPNPNVWFLRNVIVDGAVKEGTGLNVQVGGDLRTKGSWMPSSTLIGLRNPPSGYTTREHVLSLADTTVDGRITVVSGHTAKLVGNNALTHLHIEKNAHAIVPQEAALEWRGQPGEIDIRRLERKGKVTVTQDMTDDDRRPKRYFYDGHATASHLSKGRMLSVVSHPGKPEGLSHAIPGWWELPPVPTEEPVELHLMSLCYEERRRRSDPDTPLIIFHSPDGKTGWTPVELYPRVWERYVPGKRPLRCQKMTQPAASGAYAFSYDEDDGTRLAVYAMPERSFVNPERVSGFEDISPFVAAELEAKQLFVHGNWSYVLERDGKRVTTEREYLAPKIWRRVDGKIVGAKFVPNHRVPFEVDSARSNPEEGFIPLELEENAWIDVPGNKFWNLKDNTVSYMDWIIEVKGRPSFGRIHYRMLIQIRDRKYRIIQFPTRVLDEQQFRKLKKRKLTSAPVTVPKKCKQASTACLDTGWVELPRAIPSARLPPSR